MYDARKFRPVVTVPFAALAVFFALSGTARAQSGLLSDQARISVLTITPGRAVYSMFGHNAFRVRDPARGLDRVYNYGTFDYENIALFAFRFSYGQTEYTLSTDSFRHSVQIYRDLERRDIIEQVLNLSPRDRQALYRHLVFSSLPENRNYRYDPIDANCSTKMRDALLAVLGNRLHLPGSESSGATYRDLLDRYGKSRPGFDIGYDVLTGARLDRQATARESMFLPFEFADALDRARIGGEPLVASRDTLVWMAEIPYDRPAFPVPSVVTWFIFLVAFGLTVREDVYKRPVGRVFDTVILTLAGLLGLALCYLWFVSQHRICDYNLHLAWALPTHLAAAILVARGRKDAWLAVYLWAGALLCVLLLVFWPVLPQDLTAPIAPLIMTLGLRMGWRANRLRAIPRGNKHLKGVGAF